MTDDAMRLWGKSVVYSGPSVWDMTKRNEHVWTTEPPKEPGWYWAVAAAIPRAKPWVVFVDKSGYVVVPGFIHRSAVEPFTHWLGPLTVPEPPKE